MRSVEECYRGKTVRVFRLDRAGTLVRLTEAARRIVEERPEVTEVRLFGSLARGDARPGSDADLLIVVRGPAPPFLERPTALAPCFGGVGIGCDLFVYTDSELDGLRRDGNPLVRSAETEGLVLASRRTPSAQTG